MKIFLTSFVLLLFANLTTGQDLQIIQGQLIDQKTGKGIGYANIGIPERGIGTTSNDDGHFTFKVPAYYKNSTLIVSVIGYETFKKPLNAFTGPTIIELIPTSYSLDEITIVDDGGVENIIRKAVQNIPNNYPTHGTKVLGFYRESRTDSSDSHVYLAEGVLNIYKTSYLKQDEGMVSLVQGRKLNMKNPLDTLIRGGFSSGHMAANRFDFVKNREDFIDEDYFPAYKYWIEKITTYNDRKVYVIGFDRDPDAKNLKKKKIRKRSIIARIFGNSEANLMDARLRGKVYIDQESYAFIRAEFEVTEKGLHQTEDYPLYSGYWTFNTYVVNYQKIGDKWYFSDALREGGRRSGGIYSNEIKITENEGKKEKPIPYLERLSRGEEFVDMTGKYDENFWKSYNTVPMSVKLAESMQQYKNEQSSLQAFAPEKMQEIQELRDSITIAKRIAEAEKKAKENNETLDLENIDFGEPGIVKAKNRKYRMQWQVGLGTHLLQTNDTPLSISYLDNDSGAALFSISDQFNAREFEVIGSSDLNFVINNRWFIKTGWARDFGRTIYKESSTGIGVQFNLSPQRPVLLKFAVQHSQLRYGRYLGIADNELGRFNIGNKTFNSDNIRVFYGSRSRNLKLSGELAIEINKNREFFIKGSYYLPYAQKEEVYFREASWLFGKKERIDITSQQLNVQSRDVPYDDPILHSGNIQLTLGYVIK